MTEASRLGGLASGVKRQWRRAAKDKRAAGEKAAAILLGPDTQLRGMLREAIRDALKEGAWGHVKHKYCGDGWLEAMLDEQAVRVERAVAKFMGDK